MPIQKFKTLEDADKALWNFNPDTKYYESLHALFELAFTYSGIYCDRGIHKFKTLDDANEHCLKQLNAQIRKDNVDVE